MIEGHHSTKSSKSMSYDETPQNSLTKKWKVCAQKMELLHSEKQKFSQNQNSALKIGNSALAKCKFCPPKLQRCSEKTKIPHSENGNFALRNGNRGLKNGNSTFAFPWFFTPNPAILHCCAQVKFCAKFCDWWILKDCTCTSLVTQGLVLIL